jgi:hypothetical protein
MPCPVFLTCLQGSANTITLTLEVSKPNLTPVYIETVLVSVSFLRHHGNG